MQILNLGVRLIEQQIQSHSEQSRLNEFESLLCLLKEAVQEGILVVDRNGSIIDLNRKCLNLLGTPDSNKYFGLDLHEVIRNGNKLIPKILSATTDCVGDKFDLSNDTQNVRCSIVRKEIIRNPWGYDKTLILFKAEHAREVKTPNAPPLFTFNDIIGESQAWETIKQMAGKAAHFSSNVLIDGESGTGKEMVAQAIHTASDCTGSFIPVNCGAIPKDLIESELFGHEEGSFTGARRGGMIGKIEMADNGTLFLDEIGEMSPDMQVHLLRFLQDRYVTRVGGTTSKHVDVRVIAATNRNLQQLIKDGRFREDLYFRLNVINISIPPLRMRKEDIPILTQYFVHRFCSKFKRSPLGVDKTTLDALCRYDWPGNVRELSNIVENAVVFAEGDVALPKVLPEYIREYLPTQSIKDKDIRDFEKALILDALESYQGNISKSAKALGMARNTLYRKMKKMCLE
jgi:transcriptional regulator with PAS, ATPase and Fis domain